MATIADICEKSFGAIIQVLSTNSGGTGFFVGENLIFTNSHVVTSLKDIRIKNHSKNEWQAKAIYRDPKMDICILESEVPCGTSLSLLSDEDQIKIGQEVVAVGHPLSLDYSVSRGIVSSKAREIEGRNFYQTDAAIGPGNSGGPLLNLDCKVVGMITMGMRQASGLNFAIPSFVLQETLDAVGKDDFRNTALCNVCGVSNEIEIQYCSSCGHKQEVHFSEGAASSPELVSQELNDSEQRPCVCCQFVGNSESETYCQNCGTKYWQPSD